MFTAGELFAGNDGAQFSWSHAPEEQHKLWAARHSVYYAIVSQRTNSRVCSLVKLDSNEYSDLNSCKRMIWLWYPNYCK